MSFWRKEAFERFPEYRKELQGEKLIHCFLSMLHTHLLEAYRISDFELITRIRDYVFCLSNTSPGHDASSDLGTIVAVSFFEHLPESRMIRDDIGRWFSEAELLNMRELFTYHGSDAQFEEMLCSARSWRKNSKPNQSSETTPLARRVST